jgi:fibronectin-binding autotransporter adhesin
MKKKTIVSFTSIIKTGTLFAVFTLMTGMAQAASGTWNTSTSGDWGTAGNWNPAAVPGTAAGDTVSLTFNLTAACTNTIDTTPRTVGTLNIGDPTTSFFPYTLAASGGGTLTFDNNGSGAALNKTNNATATDVISAPVILNDKLTITAPQPLTISGDISETGGARALTKAGTNTLTISGNNSYSGTTTISASGGSIILNNLNAIANSTNISVASGTSLRFGVLAGGTYATAGTISIAGTGVATLPGGAGALWFGQGGSYTSTLNAPINLTAAATIGSFGNVMTQTLGGAITGTGPLTIQSQGGTTTDSATWTLNAASTYSSNTIFTTSGGVFDMTVKLGVDNALPVGTSLNLQSSNSQAVNSFTTFDLNGFNQTLAGLTDTGGTPPAANNVGKRVINSSATLSTLTISNAVGVTYGTTGTRILPGTLGGKTAAGVDANNLALTKTGAGDLTLSGTNTYTGTTTINRGRIQVATATAVPSSSAVSQSGTGQLYITGTGLTFANNFNISTFGYFENDAFANTNGAIRSDGINTFSGTITLSGNSRIGAYGNARVNTISGKITGGYGISFYGMNGANNDVQTFILSNTNNDYTGTTQIDNRDHASARTGNSTTLKLGASNVIPDGATAGNLVFNGVDANGLTIFDLNGYSDTINGLTIGGAAAGARITNSVTGASVLTVGANDTTSSFSGIINDGGVGKTLSLTKIGSGTLTLSGNNTYMGATTVDQGVLSISGGYLSAATTINIATGATLTTSINNTFSGGGTGQGGAWTIAGTITGTGNAQTMPASVTLNNGTMNGNTFAAWGTFLANGATMITANGGTNTISAGNLGIANGSVLTLNTPLATDALTVSSVLGASSALAGGLTKTGDGTSTLSGANTYTGLTTINAGTLKLQGSNMWKTARSYTINGGAVLNLDGGIDFGTGTAATTAINGTGTLRLSNGLFTRANATGAAITLSLGAGGLVDVLTGATLYNGGWQLINWAGNSGDLNVDGSFDIADANTTVGALTGTGTITKTQAGNHTLTIGTANRSGTLSGVITNATGTIALTKIGTGTQTLNGNNTYTGATTITGGLLRVNGSLSTASAISVNGGYLGGSGTVGAITVANSANSGLTLMDGSANTFTATSLTLQGSAATPNRLYFELGDAGVNDKIVLSGAHSASTTNGVLVYPSQLSGTTGSGTYTLIQGGAASTFTGYTLGVNRSGGNVYSALGASGNDLQLSVAAGDPGPTSSFAYWKGDTALWNTAQWYSDSDATAPTSSPGYDSNVRFAATTPSNLSNALGQDYEINSLTVDAGLAAVTIGAGNMLTLAATTANSNTAGNGMTVNNAAGTTIAANIFLGNSQTWTVDNGALLTVSGVISGLPNSTLTKAGDGTLSLSGVNTYAGGTTLSAGTLVAGNDLSLGPSALVFNGGTLQNAVNRTIANGMTINPSQTALIDATTNTLTLSGLITGSGALTKLGTGTLSLPGANNYSGGTTLSAGTLLAGNDLSFGTGTLTFNGGTYQNSATRTLANGITINASQSALIDTSAALTLSGIIGGNGSLTKSGASTLTLSGNNTYSGGTIINAGTLATTTDGNLGNASAGITVNGTSTWNAGAGSTVTYNRSLAVNEGAVLSLASGNATKTITGVLSGNGAIVNTATTTFDFTNTGNTFTGPVNNGYETKFASLGDSTNAINLIGSNSRFTWTGGAKTFASRPFTLQATGTGVIDQNGAGALVIQQDLAITGTAGARTIQLEGTSTAANTFAGAITNGASSTISLNKAEAGLWILSGTNNYSGVTTISAGRLRIKNGDALGITTGGTTQSGTSALEIDGTSGEVIVGAEALTINGGGISNGGALRNIAGNNTYGGTVTLAAQSRINSDSGTLTLNNATAVTGAAQNLVIGGAGNVAISGAITTGSGYVSKSDGASTLTLSGTNTYTGYTSVGAGTLEVTWLDVVANGNPLGKSSAAAANLLLGNGTTFKYTGPAASCDRAFTINGSSAGHYAILEASGTGALNMTSTASLAYNTTAQTRTLVLGGINTNNNILAATIGNNGSGAVSIIKTNAGTWTLSGANTYSGGTTMGSTSTTTNMGTLNITHSSALGTGPVSILSNSGNDRYASITLNSPTGISVANNFTTSGEGQGTNGIIRNVTGTNTITGSISMVGGGGNTRIHSDGGSLLLAGTITNGLASGARTLFLGGSATGTVSGVIANGSWPTALAKQDSGTWILSGANTYTGATTVALGTLKLGASNVLPNTTDVSIGAGTLDVWTYTDTVDTLDVTTNATINVGSGGAIAFADSSAIDWTGGTLKITGAFFSSASVRFGTSAAGLTATQLSQISIPGCGPVSIDANGYLVATRATLILFQ